MTETQRAIPYEPLTDAHGQIASAAIERAARRFTAQFLRHTIAGQAMPDNTSLIPVLKRPERTIKKAAELPRAALRTDNPIGTVPLIRPVTAEEAQRHYEVLLPEKGPQTIVAAEDTPVPADAIIGSVFQLDAEGKPVKSTKTADIDQELVLLRYAIDALLDTVGDDPKPFIEAYRNMETTAVLVQGRINESYRAKGVSPAVRREMIHDAFQAMMQWAINNRAAASTAGFLEKLDACYAAYEHAKSSHFRSSEVFRGDEEVRTLDPSLLEGREERRKAGDKRLVDGGKLEKRECLTMPSWEGYLLAGEKGKIVKQ